MNCHRIAVYFQSQGMRRGARDIRKGCDVQVYFTVPRDSGCCALKQDCEPVGLTAFAGPCLARIFGVEAYFAQLFAAFYPFRAAGKLRSSETVFGGCFSAGFCGLLHGRRSYAFFNRHLHVLPNCCSSSLVGHCCSDQYSFPLILCRKAIRLLTPKGNEPKKVFIE